MRSSLVLRNENIPVVHQEHAYDDADVALPMALPWMHEPALPFRHCESSLAARLFSILKPAALGYQLP